MSKKRRSAVLITGDKDLLSISPEALKKNGISCRIVTPQEFLENAS
jgi:predicted nucleic acid-binding protein